MAIEIKSIEDFLDRPKHRTRNAWLDIKHLHLTVYVRVSCRFLRGKTVPTIEVGNIIVFEKWRRQGFCRRFYQEVEKSADARGLTVFVENSFHRFMQASHLKRGYEIVDTSADPPCLFRWPQKESK